MIFLVMPETVETPQQTVLQSPPVPEQAPQVPLETAQPEQKSFKMLLLYLLIIVAIFGLIYGGYSLFAGKTITNNQITTVQTTPSLTPVPTVNPDLPTNNSDSQLNDDINAIDTKTSALENDLTNIDQGLNDQAVNLD